MTSIAAGTRLGPYEIESRIGAGGMGEVWKARDTRLERSVAVKVLPAELAGDVRLKARFEREAKTISQLQHPHICTLFDVGENYLVMELLDGQTLADLLLRGPLPLPDVLKYGAQIADALDRAHRAGVVHRDLKPGNIMITRSGAKLLDFGLARDCAAVQFGAGDATEQKPLTQEGSIVGTLQYMAPEQLEGLGADARTDLFALGSVLYEMIAGRRAFEGKTRSSLIGAIANSDPRPIAELQPLTPSSFEHIVRRCLAKDPDARWQSASDVAAELRWVVEERPQTATGAPRPNRAAWAVSATLLVFLIAAGAVAIRDRARLKHLSRPVHLEIEAPPGTVISDAAAPLVSPDGRKILFSAGGNPDGDVWVRDLGSPDSRVVRGTQRAHGSFWSANGEEIGFFAAGKLQRIRLDGGAPQILADASNGRGGAWGKDGTILFAQSPNGPIMRISANGGPVVPAIAAESWQREGGHRWPVLLPDGRHFLYAAGGARTRSIYVAAIGGSRGRPVVTTPVAATYGDGWLLFVRGSTLMRQRFELSSLTLSGQPEVVANNLSPEVAYGNAEFSTAAGVLVYRTGAGRAAGLTWFGRDGSKLASVGPAGAYDHVELSPDGTLAVADDVEATTGERDVWVLDLKKGSRSRFTFGGSANWIPVWAPDSRRIAFISDRTGVQNLYLQSLDGVDSEQRILATPERQHHLDWSADGKFVAFERASSTKVARTEIWALEVATGRTRRVVMSHADVLTPRISPDGRWIAYASPASGRSEVYVQRFPEGGGKAQVSTNGGGGIRWRADGRELFYVASGREMMAAAVREEKGRFEADTPRTLFEGRFFNDHAWDVTPDGQKFLMSSFSDTGQRTSIHVVLNWLDQ